MNEVEKDRAALQRVDEIVQRQYERDRKTKEQNFKIADLERKLASAKAEIENQCALKSKISQLEADNRKLSGENTLLREHNGELIAENKNLKSVVGAKEEALRRRPLPHTPK